MIDWSAAAALLMLMGGGDTALGAHEPIQFAQVSIRRQIIVRVPVRLREVAPPKAPQVEWEESRGPKCVPAKSIVGASLLSQNSVDLLLRDSSRIRARLENACPALDYYYGFYIDPNADGQICADRDVIRSRMGGQCEIEAFRRLRPAPRD